jgi:two-component system nitrate/nitrite response regulator NarL
MVAAHDRARGAHSGAQKTLRVLIADDHPPTRTGARLALEKDGFLVCAEEETGLGAVAAALRHRPDVCLLGVDIPGGAIEAVAEIRSRLPQTEVVMLAAAPSDEDLFASLEVGASGFLLEEMNPARLGHALVGVLRGEAALPRALTARLIAEFRARAQEPVLTRRGDRELTRREWEVLDCLREGLSTRLIAERLFISQTTVRRHVGSVLRKLDVSSRQAAVDLIARRSRNLNDE